MTELRLDDKVAIVTGASRGIGRAIAVGLAQAGARTVLTGRDEAALDETAKAVAAAGGAKPAIVAADLRGPAAADEVVTQAVSTHGRLDILVNNAGATKRGDFLAMPEADFQDGFALKYYGTVRLCRAAWPHLKERRGSIVNISGIGANTPEPEFTIGGSVNSALINFTKAIAARAIEEGIQINLINPGHIATDRLVGRIRDFAKRNNLSEEDAREGLRKDYGISRFGEPEDIANMVVFLCSPLASYVHGATIDVDGGATRGI